MARWILIRTPLKGPLAELRCSSLSARNSIHFGSPLCCVRDIAHELVMNWTWATSLDQVWRTPAFPMWLTLAAAGFFGIIALVTLLRAERSVANGALTVITLVAVGIAVAATIRGYGPAGRSASGESAPSPAGGAALPALSCIDDFAGDTVLAACEKKLFGSAESAAAAVSYAAYQISRLTALGDVAAANQAMNPELQALRRAVERDRYGLMAQALQARDGCTPTACAAFRSMTDSRQIAANMDQHTYDVLVARYAASWNAPPPAAAVPVAAAIAGPVAGLGPSVPTGKPTNADFPSAASTPPVSIMTPEPALPQRSSPAAANASIQPPHQSPSPAAAAKKPVPPKREPVASAPVQISPAARAPADAND